MKISIRVLTFWLCCIAFNVSAQNDQPYHEPYRPQVHFSPLQHWINDPNGMVYFDHTYHLFFQYYPGGTTWGPMHWGHATSPDLMHWKEQPIALFPDELGYIFSGSAVVDSNNTSGFGKDGKIPLVAIFTHHDPKGEKTGASNFQNQSIAYSLDGGNTWTKYAGNPVLKNPGIKDFRDPKVMWYAPAKKWIMTLATKDCVTFYSSQNLKDWQRERDFGKDRKMGAHGGTWECPDLFPLTLNNKTYWVLIANVNPGGPNGGSATQYFVGNFGGNKFAPIDSRTRWLDYGPDEYAGITWSNTGPRKIFLGWMSNWTYANQVPTEKWRGAMTIPRELGLKQVDNELLLTSVPVAELADIKNTPVNLLNTNKPVSVPPQFILKMTIGKVADTKVILTNPAGDTLVFGFDKEYKRYYLDRSKSGRVDFNTTFATMNFAPCFSKTAPGEVELVVDASSVEVFADGGLTVMTALFFPREPLSQLKIVGSSVKGVSMIPLRGIW